jgi:hypothetical protein
MPDFVRKRVAQCPKTHAILEGVLIKPIAQLVIDYFALELIHHVPWKIVYNYLGAVGAAEQCTIAANCSNDYIFAALIDAAIFAGYWPLALDLIMKRHARYPYGQYVSGDALIYAIKHTDSLALLRMLFVIVPMNDTKITLFKRIQLVIDRFDVKAMQACVDAFAGYSLWIANAFIDYVGCILPTDRDMQRKLEHLEAIAHLILPCGLMSIPLACWQRYKLLAWLSRISAKHQMVLDWDDLAASSDMQTVTIAIRNMSCFALMERFKRAAVAKDRHTLSIRAYLGEMCAISRTTLYSNRNSFPKYVATMIDQSLSYKSPRRKCACKKGELCTNQPTHLRPSRRARYRHAWHRQSRSSDQAASAPTAAHSPESGLDDHASAASVSRQASGQ